MPSSPDSLASLEAHRDRLKLQLAALNDLRPGSLVERYRKCGKPNCRCAQPGATGHGPSYSLTHGVGGKTVTKIIPANYVEQTRQQLLEHQRFRQLTHDLVAVNEKICDARLRGSESEDDTKKNFARRSSGSRLRL
jgi:hypothetical protein